MITACPKITLKSSIITQLRRNQYNRVYKCYYRNYTQKAGPPQNPTSRKSSGGLFAIGTFTLLSGVTLCYAKYDEDFRKYLGSNVPFVETIIKFVFQEERTFEDRYNSVSKSVSSLFTPNEEVKTDNSLIKSQIPIIQKHEKPDKKPSKAKVEASEEKNVNRKPAEVANKPEEPVAAPKVEETKPFHVVNIENELSNMADAALKSYSVAVAALRNFSNEINSVIEKNFEKIDAKSWHKLKVSSEHKNQLIEQANQRAKEALETVQMYKNMFERGDVKVPENLFSTTLQNIGKIEKQIIEAKDSYIRELSNATVTQRFWDKVGEARKKYHEELGILCPSIKLEETKLNLSDGEIDLFILHAQKKIEYLQKELARMETIRDQELNKALEKARQEGDINPVLEEQLRNKLEKEKRQLIESFQKKALEVQADAEREIKAQLKRQAEAHSDHLTDAVKSKELEMRRLFERQLNEEVLRAKLEYKTQLAAMVGRLKGVDSALKVRADADKNAHKAQALWSACQSLHQAIKADEFGDKNEIKPLQMEIKAIANAAIEGDELVRVVIESIPSLAMVRGVFNESLLKERFPQVEKVSRRLALVPEEGARLPVYLLSFLQSLLLVNASSPITKAELNDEVIDFSEFTTNDILQRAKYWVERGDLHLTLRYMNLLKGASRIVAEEWMREVQIYLETKQAANTLMAHAAANGLVYL